MRARAGALVAVACAVTFVIGLIVGRSTSQSGVRIYQNEVNGKILMTAYHSDWPTYGLSIAEMAALNNLMAGGLDADKFERASRLVNRTLDLAVIDAHQRVENLPHLPEAEAAAVRKLLGEARKSREGHPPPASYEPWEGERVESILSLY